MNRANRIRASVAAMLVVATGIALAAADSAKESKAAPKKRTGAELYAINCARCHTERYPTERTDAQWKTIMLHMRVRAQLTAEDSKNILEYLKETN